MKTNQIKTSMSLAAALATFALTPQAEAGVVMSFEEVGTTVVATVSGSFSIDIAPAGVSGGPVNSSLAGGSSTSLYALSPNWRYSTPGTASTVDGLTGPSSWTGSIGYIGGTFYWDSALGAATLPAGTDVSSATASTITWNGKDLDNIITGGLTTTPVTAWTLNGGAASDTITFVAAPVPEPSTTALLGLGGLALILRRRK